MGKNSKNSITIRIDNERKKQIEAVAALEGVSVSDFVRNATIYYLSKDISYQGQVQGAIETLRTDIKRIDKNLDLFSMLFLHFTEYYFAYTKSFGDISEAQKIILAEQGQARSKSMVEAFKRKVRKVKFGLLEILFADLLVQEKKEG